MAFLVLLENLTPVARAVFLLREVFDYEYAEIAQMVDCSEHACRQIFSRARKEIAGRQRRFTPSPEAHRRLPAGFVQAVGAATRPLRGREHVAAFMIASPRFISMEAISFDMPNGNGEPAIVMRERGRTFVVMTFEIDGGQIRCMRFTANPEKLRRL